MAHVAGATALGDLATAVAIRGEETAIIAELKAGSESAYEWLIGHYHQPIYSLVHRILADPADAPDTTQEVFIKVFRGMKNFNGEASLKTWIYRIAIHEASNQKRWWSRHKRRETTIESQESRDAEEPGLPLRDTLQDAHESPFDNVAHEEVRQRVEQELKMVSEPYRTCVVLRDLEDFSYEEIAEILQISIGTVKSRLMRGRAALKARLILYVGQAKLGARELRKQPARAHGLSPWKVGARLGAQQ